MEIFRSLSRGFLLLSPVSLTHEETVLEVLVVGVGAAEGVLMM